MWQAFVVTALDEPGRAIGLMRRALAEGQPCGLWMHFDPDPQSLWDNQDYQDLIKPKE